MIPLRLKYEAEKSRIVMVAVVAVIFLVAAACKELYDVYQKSFGKGLQFLDYPSGWSDSGWTDCSYDDLSGRVREGQREDYGEEGVLRHYKH